jgi:hypothetical protein
MQLTPLNQTFGQEDQSWLASADGTDFARPVTIDITKLTPSIHYPNGYLASGIPLAKLTATGLYAPYAPETDSVQSVTVTGAPTGGTFTLTWDGDTTTALNHNCANTDVLAALEALADIGNGNVAVSGPVGGPFLVTFEGTLASAAEASMTATASLTGGTTPGVTIASTTTGGAAGASDGQQTLAGFLFTSIEVINRDGSTPAVVSGAILDRCKVLAAKLLFPVDAAGVAQVAGRIIFL